jgi:geranylgeranyl pyrophosphate synthase
VRGRPIDALARYGSKVGLAFQITDDLLDAVGDIESTGKQVGKDPDRGRLTYPRLIGVEASRRMAASLVEEACDALNCLGERAEGLKALARSLPERIR